MNTNFKIIGLTRLGIKPESTAPEADALTTRPSELLNARFALIMNLKFCPSLIVFLGLHLKVEKRDLIVHLLSCSLHNSLILLFFGLVSMNYCVCYFRLLLRGRKKIRMMMMKH